jgi:hypothetical protein
MCIAAMAILHMPYCNVHCRYSNFAFAILQCALPLLQFCICHTAVCIAASAILHMPFCGMQRPFGSFLPGLRRYAYRPGGGGLPAKTCCLKPVSEQPRWPVRKYTTPQAGETVNMGLKLGKYRRAGGIGQGN